MINANLEACGHQPSAPGLMVTEVVLPVLYCGSVSPMEPRSNADKARMRVCGAMARGGLHPKILPQRIWAPNETNEMQLESQGSRRGAEGLRGLL